MVQPSRIELLGICFVAGKEYQEDTVFISGIPPHVNEDQIAEMFGSIGIIKVCTRRILFQNYDVLELSKFFERGQKRFMVNFNVEEFFYFSILLRLVISFFFLSLFRITFSLFFHSKSC